MSVHHGKEGEVAIGGTGVGELQSFTLETTGDVVESTKMSDAAKTFVAGRTSFSGTSLSFKLMPEGSSSGDRKFEGTGIVTGMSVNQPMDGIVARSVTFQGTGALTIGTE